MTGVRSDDPNDTVPHELRRDLRGLRLVAAWLDHVDFRSGNTVDVFLPDPGDPEKRGHLVHYLIDLNGTLGAWSSGWKPPWMGHEPVFHPIEQMSEALHLWRPPWADVPLAHPALGYLDADHFDPRAWTPVYRAEPFARATLLDDFWAARRIAAFDDEQLRVVVRAADWPDPAAAEILERILRERRQKIAATYFDFRHINPLDELAIAGGDLTFRDLAVSTGVVAPSSVVYHFRIGGRGAARSLEPRLPLGSEPSAGSVEIETSHDGGATWSPPLRVSLVNGAVSGIERSVR